MILRQILVSSAYKAILVPGDTVLCMSLMKRTNNNDPRMESCGTPDFTLHMFDLVLLTYKV